MHGLALFGILVGFGMIGVAGLTNEAMIGGPGIAILILSYVVFHLTDPQRGKRHGSSTYDGSSRRERSSFDWGSRSSSSRSSRSTPSRSSSSSRSSSRSSSSSSSSRSWGKSSSSKKSYGGGGGKFGGGGAKSKW